MNVRSQQNSVNDGKFNKFNLLWLYLASRNISCLNNPSEACKVVETLYS